MFLWSKIEKRAVTPRELHLGDPRGGPGRSPKGLGAPLGKQSRPGSSLDGPRGASEGPPARLLDPPEGQDPWRLCRESRFGQRNIFFDGWRKFRWSEPVRFGPGERPNRFWPTYAKGESIFVLDPKIPKRHGGRVRGGFARLGVRGNGRPEARIPRACA